MTKTNGTGNGLGGGASLTIGTVATVVVLGGGIFLARGGVLGPGTQAAVDDALAMLGLIEAPAPVTVPVADVANTAAEPVAEPIAVVKRDTEEPAVESAQEEPAEEAAAPTLDEAQVAEAEEAAPEEPAFSLTAPVLELARFETDGSGLVAGAAQPGVAIDVLLDGAVIESLTVDEGGEFAAFVALEPSDQPRVLSLVARFDGEELSSEDSFILAPIAPTVVAEVEPEAVETPAPTEMAEAVTEEPSPVEAEPAAAPEVETEVQPEVEAVVAEAAEAVTEAVSEVADAVEEAVADVTVATTGAADAPVETQEAVTIASAETETAAVVEPATTPEAELETASDASNVEAAEEVEETQAPQPEPAQVVTELSAEPEAPTSDVEEPTVSAAAGDQTATPGTEGTAAPETTAASEEQAVDADAESAPKPDVAVAVLRANKDGVSLVQPATPVAPEFLGKVALDTISYTDSGDVQLAGRAKPEALVRVYLDNSPVSDITVDLAGHWSGSLTSVAPGIYTLRLDEIDPIEGKVLSRLETPFKREAPEALQPIVTAETSPGTTTPSVQAITVQKGDTLWAISQARYGSGFLYVRVFEANKGDIRNPDLIYPGQIFTLPE